jgi:hypothetical protein
MSTLERHLQIEHLGLCLPYLTPKYLCMLRCTCSELRDMRVSWQAHSIGHELDGSCSATSWLHRNIVSMRDLRLSLSCCLPKRTLQDLLSVGR